MLKPAATTKQPAAAPKPVHQRGEAGDEQGLVQGGSREGEEESASHVVYLWPALSRIHGAGSSFLALERRPASDGCIGACLAVSVTIPPPSMPPDSVGRMAFDWHTVHEEKAVHVHGRTRKAYW